MNQNSRKRYALSAFLVFIGSAAISVGAEQADNGPLALAAARRTALMHNWDLLAAKSGVELAIAQKMVAKEFPNPTLSLSTSKINTDGRDNGTTAGNGLWDRSYDTIIAVSQLIEIGGKRAARQASAQAGIEAAKARFDDARRQLYDGVTRAYVAAVLANENADILTESAQQLLKETDIAKIRFKAGDISESDLSQIELAAARDQLGARNAEAGATAARIALEVLLGEKNPVGRTALADSLDALANTGNDLLAGGMQSAAKRPDLLAAEAALRQSENDLKLQKAERIPDPTVSLQYEHQPADTPETVGIGVSLPLPLWSRNGGAIRSAQIAREQAARDVEKAKAQIVSDIASAQAAFAEAAARWKQYSDDLRPLSAKVRESVAFAYEKGGAKLLDLLEAERADNDTRLAEAQSAADAATAASSLNSALNKLDQPPVAEQEAR